MSFYALLAQLLYSTTIRRRAICISFHSTTKEMHIYFRIDCLLTIFDQQNIRKHCLSNKHLLYKQCKYQKPLNFDHLDICILLHPNIVLHHNSCSY